MTKKIKEFENWLDDMTLLFSEEPMFNIKEEETEYTCCGDEITQQVKEIGICPTCLENI